MTPNPRGLMIVQGCIGSVSSALPAKMARYVQAGQIAPAQNEQTIQVRYEIAGNQATQNEGSEPARCVFQRKHERSKGRGRFCWGWGF